jgi:hypothetical protein
VEGKKDLYIAVADRWVPEHMDLKYEEYKNIFEKAFHPEFDGPINMDSLPKMKEGQISENTSIAEYVWLPLKFDGTQVYIDWMDEWKIEEME